MSTTRPCLIASLMAAFQLLAATPLHTQAPAVELEGYYAQAPARPIETAALPARLSCTTVCVLRTQDLDPITGTAPRMPATAREEMDDVLLTARAPHLPRSTKWDTYR